MEIEGTLTQVAPGFDILIQARLFTTAHLAEQLSPAALRMSATDELISLVPTLCAAYRGAWTGSPARSSTGVSDSTSGCSPIRATALRSTQD